MYSAILILKLIGLVLIYQKRFVIILKKLVTMVMNILVIKLIDIILLLKN